MEEYLRSILKADSSVVALSGGRVDWGARPQGDALPAVILRLIDGSVGRHLKGPDGLWMGRVQIDCWGASYGAAKGLSRAVIAALSPQREGQLRRAEHVLTRDDRQEGPDDTSRAFRTQVDFSITWKE
jgi:hypothetical protein